ncbi:MAG: hypothetical protein QOE32_455 [Pseudonocardiales bacterium]|nr:hypothetical protein [Pseudonocardiales bacterium]
MRSHPAVQPSTHDDAGYWWDHGRDARSVTDGGSPNRAVYAAAKRPM